MTSYDLTARRRFSKEEKAAVVAESLREGSVSSVARRHGVHPAQLFRWRKEAAASASAPRFVPALVEAPATPTEQVPREAAAAEALVEIVFADGSTLRVKGAVDEARIIRLARALKA